MKKTKGYMKLVLFFGEGGRFFWKRFWEENKKREERDEFVNDTIKRKEFT